ncbi:MAG: tetratricopeptide repeat protein, partial [Planctomycetales bacterium]|nr:tetratricopeptide repeat protein [Planctomycetales bacterium]
LGQLADQYPLLRNSPLQIVALSVDGLGKQVSTFEDAEEVFRRLTLPFALGKATPELLDQLQRLNDMLFMAKRPLPLPCSFLLDHRGQLAAIYKGPVHASRLLDDLELLSANAEELIANSLERKGTWQFPPQGIYDQMFMEQVSELVRSQRVTEAIDILKELVKRSENDPLIQFQLAGLYLKTGDRERAERHYLRAVELRDDFVLARLNLADLLLQRRQLDEARQQYESVLRYESVADAHVKLGFIAAMGRDLAGAEQHFRRATEIEPKNSEYHGNLGKALLDQGKLSQANDELRLAVNSPHPPIAARLNLAWLLATADDASIRDGQLAVALATACAEESGFQEPVSLDRLAAAYAETGDYEKAIQLSEHAVTIARQSRPRTYWQPIADRGEQFRRHQPFRIQGVPTTSAERP